MADATHKLTKDLIELSDLFRRAAKFDDQKTVEELVLLTHSLGCAITYIRPEFDMYTEVNRTAILDISTIMKDMAIIASRAGLSKLLLPLHKDDPYTEIIRKYVIDENRFAVDFEFRVNGYNRDLDDTGYIRSEIKTFLDEGIRGLGAIDDNLKYKWDNDIRVGGQLNLDIFTK